MRRQRKLTPAQRRVLLSITDNGEFRHYQHDGEIRRKLIRRGYVTLEVGRFRWGYRHMYMMTPKGLAALVMTPKGTR